VSGGAVLIAGGSGVFGQHLARELLRGTQARLILAARDTARLEAVRHELGSPDRIGVTAVDLGDPASLAQAVRRADATVVACTAGPFQALPPGLPASAVAAGAHWLDIADAPGWVLRILDDHDLDHAARTAGVAVVTGLSTVPAVSGALARWCHSAVPGARGGRVTLFIGNRNPKGAGATASALIGGFRDPEWVDLPMGRRRAYRFETADEELFLRDFGLEAEFRVALEWAYLGRWTEALGRLSHGLGVAGQGRLAGVLSRLSAPFARFGTESGAIQVELWDEAGKGVAAAAVAGQRLVILPCALAVEMVLDGRMAGGAGVLHPAEWILAEDLLSALRARGVRLVTRDYTPGRR
jgi:NAD(P)-dependent dehydrogenase (short-subunit alcohol dehydrogenase family)